MALVRAPSFCTGGDPAAETREEHHEEGHPPRVRGHPGHLYVWEHVHDPQHGDIGQPCMPTSAPNCHPFYTGKQKILDTGGRVARFQARYAKKAAN